VIHQPHGDFGYACGPLADLDAIEGVDIHEREASDVEFLRPPAAIEHPENLDFHQTQFTVRDDQEIAAAARRIEEAQSRELLVEAF
jgi:Zn-dependent M28 family amino/carboxypeptidase